MVSSHRVERFDSGDTVFGDGTSFYEMSRRSGFLGLGRTLLYKYSPGLREARINSRLSDVEKGELRAEIVTRFPTANIKELEDP